MTGDDAVRAVFRALDEANLRYMLVGSLASNFYGVPRATRDADLVVELVAGGIERLAGALPPEMRIDAQPAFEAVTGTTRYLITATGTPFVCELFILGDDPHDVARFARRQRVTLGGTAVSLATAEDMVVTKLRWARDAARAKDRDDIRNILAVQGARLDWNYIRNWTDRHDTTALLEELRRSLPSR